MDILRFITAGNVDDGKSTLIGRLLYDTNNIKDDVLESVAKPDGSDAAINLAYLTDGLRAEREQGITIDVAYKYFTTPQRKYIISDAPGHFQYTKNLVTGASGVDAIIILVDALNGITPQTRRHSQVAAFLNIENVVVAINKMDAEDYNEAIYNNIKADYMVIAQQLGLSAITFIPISALAGDNVLQPSHKMPWYSGQTLMAWLENCAPQTLDFEEVRFSVQCSIAPKNSSETGFAGKLLSGTLRVDDKLNVDTRNETTTITKILNGYTAVVEATAGDNLVLFTTNDANIGRGSLLSTGNTLQNSVQLQVTLCWLNDKEPLQVNTYYLLRINTTERLCKITAITGKLNLATLQYEGYDEPVSVNDFVKAIIELESPIVFDAFAQLPENGRGILIDLTNNYTAAAFTIS